MSHGNSLHCETGMQQNYYTCQCGTCHELFFADKSTDICDACAKLVESARTITDQKGDCSDPVYVYCTDCPAYFCAWEKDKLHHAKAYIEEHTKQP